MSVEPEDFLEAWGSTVGDAILEELGHCVLPPRRDVLLRHESGCGLDIVGLEVSEHLVPLRKIV